MAAEIRWSDNAISDYNNVVDYLLFEWNEDIALRFIEILEHKVQLILKQPYTGMLSSKASDIRSILITKHNRLYYRIFDKNMLEIVNIFDTRQHPDKDKYR
jgi:plasmid stabilization system protein ParE